MAIIIGSNNVVNSVVENAEFVDLLQTLDMKYKVPGQSAMRLELEKIDIEIKAKATTFLQEASKIYISADIWSKKGLTASFLGITAHFFL